MRRFSVRLVALAMSMTIVAGPAAAADKLPADVLEKIKAATVFIMVNTKLGAGSGSGFLIRTEGDTGWIVTNHHVVEGEDGLAGEILDQKLNMIFHSGTPQEWSVPGTVVADDIDNDIAMVKVTLKAKMKFPAPLALVAADNVQETTPIFICGFPFGASIAARGKNPELTINSGTVSSLRKNEDGEVVRVQLNGEMNPGNSGGPVVAADGKLIGVSVSGLRGTKLNFAVPHGQVVKMLRGRLENEPEFALSLDAAERRVRFRLIDPYFKLKDHKVHYAPAGKASFKVNSTPKEVQSLPDSVTLALQPLEGDPQRLEATFTKLKVDQEIWVQTEWIDSEGKKKLSEANRVKIPDKNKTGERRDTGAAAALGPTVVRGSLTGMKDLDGKPLPPLGIKALEPDPKPEHWIDLGDLNRTARDQIGKTFCVHALQFDLKSDLRGKFLECYYDDDNTQPSDIEFEVDKVIYDAVVQFRNRNGLRRGGKLAVRMTGELRKAASDSWQWLSVDRLEFLAADGSVALKFVRREASSAPFQDRKTDAEQSRQITEKSLITFTRLADAPRKISGTFELLVKSDGVEEESPTKTDTEKPLQRLLVTRDHRGESVKNLAVYLDDELAKSVAVLFRNDKQLKEQDIHLVLKTRRFDEARGLVVASVDSFRVLTSGITRTVKHELKSTVETDFTAPIGRDAPVDPLPMTVPSTVPPTVADAPKASVPPAPVDSSTKTPSVNAPQPVAKETESSTKLLLIIGIAVVALGGLGLLVWAVVRSRTDNSRGDDDYEDEAPRRKHRDDHRHGHRHDHRDDDPPPKKKKRPRHD